MAQTLSIRIALQCSSEEGKKEHISAISVKRCSFRSAHKETAPQNVLTQEKIGPLHLQTTCSIKRNAIFNGLFKLNISSVMCFFFFFFLFQSLFSQSSAAGDAQNSAFLFFKVFCLICAAICAACFPPLAGCSVCWRLDRLFRVESANKGARWIVR